MDFLSHEKVEILKKVYFDISLSAKWSSRGEAQAAQMKEQHGWLPPSSSAQNLQFTINMVNYRLVQVSKCWGTADVEAESDSLSPYEIPFTSVY